MLNFMSEIVLQHSVASVSDSSPYLLLASGPAAAIAIYVFLYLYYRNTDKRHNYEYDTRIESQPITGNDDYRARYTRLRNPNLEGRNEGRYRDRVQRVQPPS